MTYGKLIFFACFALAQALPERSLLDPTLWEFSPSCANYYDHHLIQHEYDCSKFYYCEYGMKRIAPTNCPPDTEFSYSLQVCDHPFNANCNLSGVSTEAPATPAPTTQAPTTQAPSTQAPTTTQSPPTTTNCEEDSAQRCLDSCNVLPWAHADCDKFYQCNGPNLIITTCSEGLHFNPNTFTCDMICNAGCLRTHLQSTQGADGIRIFVPFNSRTSQIMDMIVEAAQ